jgi:hypothetical protein
MTAIYRPGFQPFGDWASEHGASPHAGIVRAVGADTKMPVQAGSIPYGQYKLRYYLRAIEIDPCGGAGYTC